MKNKIFIGRRINKILIIQTSPTRKNTIKKRNKNYEEKSCKSENVCGVSKKTGSIHSITCFNLDYVDL